MQAPSKAKRGLCATALKVLELRLEYHVLRRLAGLFAFVFSLIEQRKARLQDLLAKEGREQ